MADASSPFAQLQTGAPDPGKMLGLIGQINQIKDFQAKQAVGEAFQQATDPTTGLTDNAKFQGLVKSNPAAALRAPEAGAAGASLVGQNISNATSQFGLNSAQTQFLSNLAGSFIGKKGGATDADLATARTIAARNGIPLALTEGVLAGGPGDTRSPQQRFKDLQSLALGSGGRTAPQVTGVDQNGNPVTGTTEEFMREATPGGNPGSQPAPGTPVVPPVKNTNAFAPGETILPINSPPGIVTQPPPGFADRTAQSVHQIGALQDAYDSSSTRKGMLGNLENDLQNFTSGPGADWTKVAKSWVNRNVPMPKDWQFDPKSIASQEQFIKQAAQLSQNQFQTLGGTGSNAQFNASYEVNPNDTLSQLGNKGIIGLLKGNEDAIQAKFSAARADEKAHGAAHYPDFSLDFNSHYDPRVFQFKYMNDADRKSYFAGMSPEDQQQLASNIEYAHSRKWVNYMAPKK